MISGKSHTMELSVTEDQMKRFEDGELIQDSFPNLSDEEREFILTGITPAEWNAAFPKEDE